MATNIHQYRTHPSQSFLTQLEVPELLPHEEFLPLRVSKGKIVSNSRNHSPDDNDDADELGDASLNLKGFTDISWFELDLDDSRFRGRPLIRTVLMLIELIIICGLILLPAILVWHLTKFEHYNLVNVKGPDGINSSMEFIRWSIYFAQAYGFWTLLCWCTSIFPLMVIQFRKVIGIPYSAASQRAWINLRYARPFINFTIYLYCQYQISMFLLFKSAMMKISILGWVSECFATMVGKFSGKDFPNTLQAFIEIEKLERLLICAIFIAVACVLEKIMMEVINRSFYHKSLEKRIIQSNERFAIINHLYSSLYPSETKYDYKAPITKVNQVSSDSTLTISKGKVIRQSSVKRARLIGKAIYTGLCPANRDYLIPNDFKPYFSNPTVNLAFGLFDTSNSGKLVYSKFRDAMEDYYLERDNLAESLVSSAKLFRKLDFCLLLFVVSLAAVLALGFYNEQGYVWMGSCVGILFTFGFMFKESGARLSNCLQFIFAQHSFDVGDLILFEGAEHVVRKIYLYSSLLIRKDGVLVYVPNHGLTSKNIVNMSRARITKEVFEITLQDKRICMNDLEEIRKKLHKFIESQIPEFFGKCTIQLKDVKEHTEHSIVWFEPLFTTPSRQSEINVRQRRSTIADELSRILAESQLDAKLTIEAP